jgi:hypothetical protein
MLLDFLWWDQCVPEYVTGSAERIHC